MYFGKHLTWWGFVPYKGFLQLMMMFWNSLLTVFYIFSLACQRLDSDVMCYHLYALYTNL